MKCIFNGFGQNSKENSKMKKKGSSPQSWELNKPPSNQREFEEFFFVCDFTLSLPVNRIIADFQVCRVF